jgi:hypothetical protein
MVEALVIIGSILLAFGIDAQWELAQERRSIAALVTGLEEDFRATVAEAQRVLGNHGGGADAAERLILLAEARPLVPTDAPIVDSLLSIVRVSGASFDPPQGAVNALLASGSLQALDEPELATRLTGWPSEVEDLRKQESGLVGRMVRFDEVLTGFGVRMDYLVATDHTGAEFGRLPWEPRPTTAWMALNSASARSALADMYLGLRFTTRSAEARVASANRIHALLTGLVE